MNAKRWSLVAILVAAGMVAAWYGWSLLPPSTGGKVSLFGAVTYNKEPLKSGTIQLTPDRLTPSPIVMGTIEDGRYRIPAVEGAVPGTYEVQVTVGKVPTKEKTIRDMGTRLLPTPPPTFTLPRLQVIQPGVEAVELNIELPP